MSDLSSAFLSAMRGLAATVSIVASEDEAGRVGLIATSVTSLSLEPPSLLVCLNRSSRSSAALLKAEIFSVNALNCDQIDVARSFGSTADRLRRFETGRWDSGRGAPILLGAQASFICRRAQTIAYGTHDILVGELLLANPNAEAQPLVYLNGAYTACNSVRLAA